MTSSSSTPAQADDTPVWLDLTQAQLDAAYDQAVYAPNQAEVTARYASRSEAVRAQLGAPVTHRYGDAAIETLDWFAPAQAGGPVNIFIHGGAWRTGKASQYHFPAGLFVPAGAHCVVPDFSSVLDTGGDLRPLVQQVRDAVAWVVRNAARLGADPGRIYISSHSSGSHLASCVALTQWQAQYGLAPDFLRGVQYCGGMYDLQPVMLSSRRLYLDVDTVTRVKLSAIRHERRYPFPICVAYGEKETPEFRRQAVAYVEALRTQHNDVTLLEHPGLNHFEILETLATPDGMLGRAALQQMGLA